MFFRTILVALLCLPALSLAAEAENPVTTGKAAIALAQSACAHTDKFEFWTARETPTTWEVQGLMAGGKARAVITVRKTGAPPTGCGILLEGFQSNYLRPL